MMEPQVAAGLVAFGKLIRKTRIEKNWSYREFARQASLGSDSTIKNWERNAILTDKFQEPSISNLRKIAPLVTNPLTGEPFKAIDLFQVCQGELQIPDELLES
jgi:transcriptional regulator with XRE-family HTH domain